ncbi:TonB-dependent receptor [Hyphomonas sp.]|uniref:TonB-dependent receptor n=1 Tax=Hyphomonas sp. TaxID=87 RepID=UPI001E048C7C|nr:TonB-dependent receptor [Hyphomonas sp.]MBU4061801.1 TonB-dependent receptor [Alphaproteobacteria bacterium]MBU4163367.1 TonB-dependent receptor [Alphaproteobacteria bacterium]
MDQIGKYMTCVGGAALLFAAGSGAFAQEQSTATDVARMDAIIVTAQKREQSLSDVPMSITAISDEDLTLLGADNFAEYAMTVPGLGYSSVGTFGNRGQRQINLRGISSNVGSSTVGYYIGETPIRFVDPRLFDISRIEVLRGPQGTLYGAGSMGGTIRLIPAAPDLGSFAAEADGTYSNTRYGEANYAGNLMVNLPLVEDKLAVRGVFFYNNDGGYIDNRTPETQPLPSFMVSDSADTLIDNVDNYNDEKAAGYRIALAIQPTENVTITPSVFHQKLEADAWTTSVKEAGELTSNFLEMSPHSEDFTLYDLTAEIDLGWAQLASSTSYTDYDLFLTEPFDRILAGAMGLPFAYVAPYRSYDEREVFVQEARLTSNGEGKFNWLIGAFYQQEDQNTRQRYVAPDINDDLFGGFPAIPNGDLFIFDAERSEEQVALFGEASYALTDRLTATVGLRWFDLSSDRYAVSDGVFNGGQTITDVSVSEHGTTPKFLLSYKATDDALVYSSVSKGFRPGFGYVKPPPGICDADLAAVGITSADGQVDSDNLWAYEVGGNTKLFNGAVFVSGAAYVNKWKNLQQSIDLPTCGFTVTENAGEAESKGFELEISASPVEGLDLDLGLGYVDAELTKSAPGLGAAEGDRLVFVPDWSVSAGLTYARPISEKIEAFLHADYQYSGDMNFNFDPSVPDLHSRKAFDIAGARIGLRGKRWETSLFVENAFDERPTLGNIRFLTSGTLTYTRRPRTIGVNFSVTY